MKHRAGKANNYSLGGLYVGTICLAWSCAGSAQGFNESVNELSGSASVFTSITQTRTDRGTSTDSNTEPGVGVSGKIGGALESGANSLVLRYGGTLATERETVRGEHSSDTAITGASRYTYFDPTNPLDFNLGHTISSVRNNSGFEVDRSSYDTRNTLSAGAGLSLHPGELTTLRLTGQAGRSYGDDLFDDQESFTAGSELSRRLSERAMGGINLSRSWSDRRGADVTIDTAQLVYSLQLESGYFSIGAGGSKAETEYPDGDTSENEAATGFVERAWVSTNTRTSMKYDRSLSDSATDLSLNQRPAFSFLPETVRLRDLVVRDSLVLAHNNRQLCSGCTFGLYAEGAILESQISGDTTHEYRAALNFGFQLASLQRLDFQYSWEGDTEEDAGVIVDQIHRLSTIWTRQLAENTTFGVEFNQAYLTTQYARGDQEQFELRLVLSHGFSLVGARQ